MSVQKEGEFKKTFIRLQFVPFKKWFPLACCCSSFSLLCFFSLFLLLLLLLLLLLSRMCTREHTKLQILIVFFFFLESAESYGSDFSIVLLYFFMMEQEQENESNGGKNRDVIRPGIQTIVKTFSFCSHINLWSSGESFVNRRITSNGMHLVSGEDICAANSFSFSVFGLIKCISENAQRETKNGRERKKKLKLFEPINQRSWWIVFVFFPHRAMRQYIFIVMQNAFWKENEAHIIAVAAATTGTTQTNQKKKKTKAQIKSLNDVHMCVRANVCVCVFVV